MSAIKRPQVDGTTKSPKKPKLEPIFTLNFDCLAEILSYLPLEDVFAVRCADPRFKEGCHLRYALGGVDCINPGFIQSVPKECLTEFLELFGRVCRFIKLKLLPEEQFWSILTKFTNLEELVLSEITLSSTTTMPVALKSLEIDRCHIPDTILYPWIPKLNDTLTSLRITCRDEENKLRAYEALHNLTLFRADGMVKEYPELIAGILSRNRDSLTNLSLISHDSHGVIPLPIWENICRLDHLTHLHLDQSDGEGDLPDGLRLFPKLTSLQLTFREDALDSIIDRLACEESLVSFAVENYSGGNDVAGFQKFENLQHLELPFGDWYALEEDPFRKLAKMRHLQSLVLNGGVFNRHQDVIQMVKRMSFLKKLSIYFISFLDEDEMDFTNIRQELPESSELKIYHDIEYILECE